jgi:hypothetical protein
MHSRRASREEAFPGGAAQQPSGWSRALLLPFTGDELELETCSV